MLPTAHHLAVRNVPDGPVLGAQHGRPQTDLLHGSRGLAEVDRVTDAVLVLDEHEQAGEEVLDDALGTEAQGDPRDAGSGDQRAEVDTEFAEHGDRRDHPDDHAGGASDDAGDRCRTGLQPRVELLPVADPDTAELLRRQGVLAQHHTVHDATEVAARQMGEDPCADHDAHTVSGVPTSQSLSLASVWLPVWS